MDTKDSSAVDQLSVEELAGKLEETERLRLTDPAHGTEATIEISGEK